MNKRNPLFFEITTNKGIYKVKTIKDIQQVYSSEATEKELGAILNIGGKEKYCVQMNIPYYGKIGKLLWIEAGNGCSLDEKEQRAEKLIHMTNLGITIAKEINYELEFLELQDSASFECKLPDGSLKSVNSTFHDLAFYQQSYYEKRYGAKLINEKIQKQYEEDKKGFTDPLQKPKVFDFGTPEIDMVLGPMYKDSKTWKEFFEKIHKKFGKEKCTVISMWISGAIVKIMNNSYSGQIWHIPIEKVEGVKYKVKRIAMGGGSVSTRKNKKKEANPIEMYTMDWSSYFKKLISRNE